MEHRHRDALRRIYEADRMWAREGREPEAFLLLHTGGGEREIDHPRWNRSWGTPSEHTIDDLNELGLLRVDPSANKSRRFSLTMRGRQEAAALVEQLTTSSGSGGRAPQQDDVLRWLARTAEEEPEAFDLPSRLLDRAVKTKTIDPSGREAFARRILNLINQGYLAGRPPGLEQTTAEQELANTQDLELTMRAHQALAPGEGSRTLNIYGSVINSQVAGGDIANYTVFAEVLERAHAEIDALDGVDDATRAEAKGLLDRLRGNAGEAAGDVGTGAAGSLVAGVIAQLLGLPLG